MDPSIKVFDRLSRLTSEQIANDVCVLLEDRINSAVANGRTPGVIARELAQLCREGNALALQSWNNLTQK